MSDKIPLYAVDKCAVVAYIPVEIKVRLDRMAADAGLSVSALAAAMLAEETKDAPFGAEELMRVNEIITENIRKRNARKAKKGVK